MESFEHLVSKDSITPLQESILIMMDVDESFVKICGEVGNFTERLMGTSIVDAYFGPPELAPSEQTKDKDADTLLRDLDALSDSISESISDSLRCAYLLGEVNSLRAVVEWLAGESKSYSGLVRSIFNIDTKKFPDGDIEEATADLGTALSDVPGNTLRDRVVRFTSEGEVVGDELTALIMGNLQNKTEVVGRMFEARVYSKIGESVIDNGVEYQTVSDVAWGGYNYYQGGYKSINQFNTDLTFNKHTLASVVYHEYEHHVSNLWREKAYLEKGFTDLSIVPLHTGRCVISEGTADTAKDFLGVSDDSPTMRAIAAQYRLGRMVSINAAFMLNQEECSIEETVDYICEKALKQRNHAEASIGFIRPTTEDGRPNIWAPYVFTYFFGRTDFVFPTFQRARDADKLAEFYRTVYLNPYSCSSASWQDAFNWL